MKSNKFVFTFASIIATVLFLSCFSMTNPSDFDMDRLVGRWVKINGSKTQIETWNESDDGYTGRGLIINDNDTTFAEELSIKKVNDKWVYQAQVPDQNANKKIPFPMESQANNRIAFSNYNHDFPQKIVYELISDDSLLVYVEGPHDGQKIRIDLVFKKD